MFFISISGEEVLIVEKSRRGKREEKDAMKAQETLQKHEETKCPMSFVQ